MNGPQALTKAQKTQAIAAMKTALALLEAAPESTACRYCLSFSQASGQCSHWQTLVPPEAQALGCPAYEEDEIPF